MISNKPEVVAWRWRKPIVNDEGETVALTGWLLSETPRFLPWWANDPLVRLSDYQKLQDEYEKLKSELDSHKAARIAYASEFPLDGDGNPDVGSIHQNIRTLKAECDALRDKTSMSIGVGDGSGSLFVHGDYDSIKRVQELIFECENLRKERA